MCLLHLLVRHCLQIVIPNNTHLMQSKKWCLSFLETWACEDTHLLESGTWSVPVMCVSGLRYFKLTLPASLLSSHLLSVHYRAALNLIDASQSREAIFFPNDLCLYNDCLFWEPVQSVGMGATAAVVQRSHGAVMSHGNSQLRWCLTLQVSLGWSYQMIFLNAEES